MKIEITIAHSPGDAFPYMATAKVGGTYAVCSEKTAALAEEGLIKRAREILSKEPDIIKEVYIHTESDPYSDEGIIGETEDDKMDREALEEVEDEIAQANEDLAEGRGQDSTNED